jgi:hypothetical protein
MASWGSQFSSGDQGNNKEIFWRNGFRKCPACGVEGNIKKCNHVAGCRHNGDGYGTETFTCQDCQWNTSFQYDDASEDCYYYETRFWSREPAAAVIIPRQELTDAFKIKFRKIFGIVGATGTRGAMEQDGISDYDINDFIAELEGPKLNEHKSVN